MSNLRIIGLIAGLFSLFLTFIVFRGPRWRRINFILSGFFSLSLIAVSLNPNILNIITGILALEYQYRGRLLTLLIGSSILLWILLLYTRTRFDEYRDQFDLLIRNLGHEEVRHVLEKEIAGKDIAVIIPAYNEAENLKSLLQRMPKKIKDKKVAVLVVDDGSSDDTSEVAKQAGCLVVRNKINRGQGSSSRLGYDVLLRHNIKIGVTMDSDNQHLPEEIEKIVTPILNNKYDLVIGSRVLGKSHKSSQLRGAGIFLLTKMINLLSGLRLTDGSSGFKAFNMNKMKRLKLTEEQFQAAELIIEAAKKGLKIGEVPITIEQRKYGQTKKGRDLRYGLHFTKSIVKAWWK